MNEMNFLDKYNPTDFNRPNLTVDIAIFTIQENKLHVLAVKRKEHPFKGKWALVGGFVDISTDLSLEDTANRKLYEKTGIKAPYLEQFQTVGNNHRDPRCWSATTVYFSLLDYRKIELQKGKTEVDIQWIAIDEIYKSFPMAFDHADLLSGCLERLRSKTMYSTIPTHLMPDIFTLSELQSVYEIIMGKRIETKSFHRRMLASNLLEDTGEVKPSGRRPARIYRVKNKKTLYFSRNMGV